MENKEKLESLARIVSGAHNIVITSHRHPDGDAVASACAWFHYLRSLQSKKVKVVLEDFSASLSFIAEGCPVSSPVDSAAILEKADLLICTDMNSLSRASETMQQALGSFKAAKILFDHHLNPAEDEFDLVFSKNDISSASEVVYYVLKALCKSAEEQQGLFGGLCGRALMAGMTTDSNNFANSVYPSTLQMAGELLAFGVDRDEIIQFLYNSCRENRVRAISHILCENLEIRDDGLAVIKVSSECWHRFGLEEGELEGLVNIPLSIAKVKMSIYLREDTSPEGTIRVSIRSKKGVSANAVARDFFHGGGHEQAAGGKLLIPQDIPDFAHSDLILKQIKL